MADSTAQAKPSKPYPEFPLYPHNSKRWAKKINGKTQYFGSWDNPAEALQLYEGFISGRQTKGVQASEVASTKPDKPYPEFPLYPHNSKRWAKKIKGRTHFFGKWDDWKGALERFQYEVDFLQQGRTPPPIDQTALSVGDMVNWMLDHRKAKLDSGELAQRTYTDYERVGTLLINELGRHRSVESLDATDFAKLRKRLSERLGLVALGNEITRIRVFFNFAFKNDLIDKPAKMGLSFDKPSRKSVKREKQTKTAKVFSVEELQTLYHAAGKQMKAFMLLALNGGLGNADIGQLEFKHLQNGWVKYPRPKTLVDRQFPLWPETSKAIEAAKQTKHLDLPLVFVTKYGQSWHKEVADSPISKEFSKLLIECGLNQIGRGFYALRHTFRTLADGCRDQMAINHIMGHSDDSMAANYTHGIEQERLQAVVDHVRNSLKTMFKKPAIKKAGAK